MTERLAARGQSGGLAMPLTVQAQVWYNPDRQVAHYMVPALIGIIMLFLCVVLTSTAIVRERERGTIEQLIVAPIRSWELLVGKLAPYVLLGVRGHDHGPGPGRAAVRCADRGSRCRFCSPVRRCSW